MNINSIHTSALPYTSASTASNSPLDGSQFMTIMLAQMRNQNPLEPMDDSQMISQMASLNSLQELQRINATLAALLQTIQQGQQAAQPEQYGSIA